MGEFKSFLSKFERVEVAAKAKGPSKPLKESFIEAINKQRGNLLSAEPVKGSWYNEEKGSLSIKIGIFKLFEDDDAVKCSKQQAGEILDNLLQCVNKGDLDAEIEAVRVKQLDAAKKQIAGRNQSTYDQLKVKSENNTLTEKERKRFMKAAKALGVSA
jgi:hypothetical protein